MDRGVRVHYWTHSSKGRKGDVYKTYTEGISRERFFQCLSCLCVMCYVAYLIYDDILVFSIVVLSVGLIMQLLQGWSASVRPPKHCKSHML